MANEVQITVKVTDRSKDIDKAKDRVDDLGDAAQRTSKDIGELGQEIGHAFRDADGRLRDARGRFTSLGDEAEGVGKTVGKTAAGMVSAFGNIGASIVGAGGPVAAVGLLGAAVAALPMIATAAGAGIALGVGAGIAGLGVAVAAQNDKVKTSFTGLTDHVMGSLKSMAGPFEGVLIRLAGRAADTFDKLAPHIQAAFHSVAPAVEQFGRVLLGSIGNMGPFIDRIVKAFGPLMGVLSARLPGMINNVGDQFARMAENADPRAFDALLTVLNNIVTAAGTTVVALEKIGSAWDKLGTREAFKKKYEWDPVKKELVEVKDKSEDAADGFRKLGDATQAAANKMREWHNAVLASYNAEIALEQSIDDASKAIKENGRTLDKNTQKGRDNRRALFAIGAEALRAADAAKKSGADSSAAMNRGYRAFIRAATGAGMTRKAAAALARQIGLIPSRKTVTIRANTRAAEHQIANLKRKLASIHDRNVGVNVHYRNYYAPGFEHGPGGPRAMGGIIGAQGGGPRSRMTLVGEQGPELVDLAPGSTVHSNPDTRRMLAQGGGPGGHLVLEFRGGSGSDLERILWQWVKENVRIRGGRGPNSAQKALGA
ncbi:MAG TPA: hypothetical protein VE465_02050 [Streptosporangiaceae bacterium]|jgi:hypothetical protein|nr:hypothetical protein [Streptosporangiaceae bacterium]